MIEAEQLEKQPGYKKRIKMINEFKEIALIDKKFENFGEHFQLTKKDMETEGISIKATSKKEEHILRKGFGFVKQFFTPSSNKQLQTKDSQKTS